MEFDKKVLQTLEPVIKKNKLRVVISFENCVELSSDNLVIRIVRNNREYSNSIWIKPVKQDSESIEIDDYIMKHHFNSQLKLTNVPIEIFLENLKIFLENPDYNILQNNSNGFTDLIEFDKIRSFEYSRNLQNKQILNEADAAWLRKDYNQFIDLVKTIHDFNLPDSYKIKLKIAYKNSKL